MLELTCQICGINYQKPDYPAEFMRYFRWSLMYCDKCRHEKEIEALKSLAKVMVALADDDKNISE